MAESGGSRSRWRLRGRRSEESEKTFRGEGYSFNYPGEWNERPFHVGVEEGSAASLVALGPGGHEDGLLLGVYELDFPITERNVDRFMDETAENVKEAFQGRISEGPTLATVAGRPAFCLELSFEKADGQALQSRMIFVFDGGTEYFLNFQFTRQRADEMRRGCERVVNTFRILPPLEVLDWWEHPGEEGRATSTGLVGVPRQLVVTTQRILVLRDGSVERTVAMASIGGAQIMEPSEWPLEDSERAVLVHSGGEQPTVWGCWSMATDEAKRLMSDILSIAHGQL